MMTTEELGEEELQEVYEWIDGIQLSRPKRNIARDFSDGVLMSEVVHSFHPRLVDLHNYVKASSTTNKTVNWNALNQKVFKKIGFKLSKKQIDAVVHAERGAIEKVLWQVKGELEDWDGQDHFGHVRLAGGDAGAAAASAGGVSGGAVRRGRSRDRGGSKTKAKVSKAKASSSSSSSSSSNKLQHPQRQQARSRSKSKSQSPSAARGSAAASKRVGSKPNRVPASPSRANGGSGGGGGDSVAEKDRVIHDLREAVELLEVKVQKLEQLLRLKDAKIDALQEQLDYH